MCAVDSQHQSAAARTAEAEDPHQEQKAPQPQEEGRPQCGHGRHGHLWRDTVPCGTQSGHIF